jgi:hypothetical protein
MIPSALPVLVAFALSSVPPATPTFKVVSVDTRYPYYGLKGNTCARGNFFVRAALSTPHDGLSPGTPVVVRLVDGEGLSPGTALTPDDVRRAGTGPDGTPVFCATGPSLPPPPVVMAPSPGDAAPEAEKKSDQPAAQAPVATSSGCSFKLYAIVKKQLAPNKFGPSEFEPDSAVTTTEGSGPVECSVARTRVTNILLVKMVKDRFEPVAAVVGAEWGSSRWEPLVDAAGEKVGQQRLVKVYLQAGATEVADNGGERAPTP